MRAEGCRPTFDARSAVPPYGLTHVGNAGRFENPGPADAIAADAGYWNEEEMDKVVSDRHNPVLVAPDNSNGDTPKRWLNGRRTRDLGASSPAIRGRSRAMREAKKQNLHGDTKHDKGGSSALTDE